METRHIKDYRSHHDVLVKPMTLKELKDNVTKDNRLSTKILQHFDDLIEFDKKALNMDTSIMITGSSDGLVNISYKVAGRTTNNEVIIKVEGDVIFKNLN